MDVARELAEPSRQRASWLKRARSPDHAMGQLTRYMGWVRQTIGRDRPVYYRTPRGHHPNWQNKFRFVSMDAVMAFDAFHLSEMLLTQPLQIVVGSKPGAFGSNRDGHELYERAASAKKDLMVVEGASHFDLYDNPQYVNLVVEKLSGFYSENVK